MDNLNLHNRLKDELGSENEIFYYSYKEHLKISSRIGVFGGDFS